MVIPEHTEIAYADGGHERADHLVELACCGPKDASECWVAHVEEGFYRGFRHRVVPGFALSLVRSHRLEPLLTSILELSWPNS